MIYYKYFILSAFLGLYACVQHPATDVYPYAACRNRYAFTGYSYDDLLLNRYSLTGERILLDSFLLRWENASRLSSVDTASWNRHQRLGFYFITRLLEEFFSGSAIHGRYYIYDGRAAIEIVDSLYPVMQDSLESEALIEDTLEYRLTDVPCSLKPLYLDQNHERILRRFLCSRSKEESLRKYQQLDSVFYIYPNPDKINSWYLKTPPSQIKILLSAKGAEARVFYSRGYKTGGWISFKKKLEVWEETEHVVWSE